MPRRDNTLFLLSGERGNLQFCLKSDADADVSAAVKTELPFRLYRVREIYSGLPIREDYKNCTLINDGRPGFYPDLLEPFDGTLHLEKNKIITLWLEVFTEGKEGNYEISFAVNGAGKEISEKAQVHIHPLKLEDQTLIYTDWFHSDCLASYYKVPVFSEEYWRITENFIKNAAEHGVNCILTPLFTPPLDTEVGGQRPTVQLVGITKTGRGYSFDFALLTRWIELCRKYGIRYFEFSHFFTQWGAKRAPKIVVRTKTGEKQRFGWHTRALSKSYLRFLKSFGKALKDYTDAMGITQRCFVHCSDEPGSGDLRHYKKCAAAVHAYFGAYVHMDALSDLEFYSKNIVPLPVPSEGAVSAFADAGAPRLWTYYCCGQYHNELPNRFFAMPSVRNRILGVLLYQYRCEGFLHWGFNFYYTQYSRRLVDPFTETDAGLQFPSGDAFTVYPGEGGEALPSLREKVFYEGLSDLRALRTAERVCGRERVCALIKDTLGEISFTSYPMEDEKFFDFRKKLFELCENE